MLFLNYITWLHDPEKLYNTVLKIKWTFLSLDIFIHIIVVVPVFVEKNPYYVDNNKCSLSPD